MRSFFKLRCVLVGIISAQLLYAQENDSALLQRMMDIEKNEGKASYFLQALTDSIGARVTGSAQCKQTSSYLLQTLKELGYQNAHLEDYQIKTTWKHQLAEAHIISPTTQSLIIGSYGWVPGTNGTITVKVVDLGIYREENLPERFEGIRGEVVIIEPLATEGHPYLEVRYTLANLLAKSGAAAMLIPSDKRDRMLYISALGFYPKAPLPVLSVAHEDALLLRRLLQLHEVKISLNINNTFNNKPSKEFNVVADLPGTSKDGMILIGAHFDSWDYAQGAQDNGAGVSAVLEVARVFKLLNIKPHNTIRFVFFSGEEQGFLGSHAYITKHEEELDLIKAILIMDDGAQTPRGFYIHQRLDMDSTIRKVLAVLSPMGATGISPQVDFESDYAPFLSAGIPALSLWVDEGDYENFHHTIIDTYEKVGTKMLSMDAATLAIATYSLAQALTGINDRLSKTEAEKYLKRVGMESFQEMLYKVWR